MNMKPLCLLSVLSFAACTGPDPESWATPADCEAVSATELRDECYTRVATEAFRASPEAGLAMLDAVSDPLVRDYILLKVTREVDPTSFRYCEKIQDDRIEERCRVLVRRPHLHRDLAGGGAEVKAGGPPQGPPQGPPTGPPPEGTAPPQGPPTGPPPEGTAAPQGTAPPR